VSVGVVMALQVLVQQAREAVLMKGVAGVGVLGQGVKTDALLPDPPLPVRLSLLLLLLLLLLI